MSVCGHSEKLSMNQRLFAMTIRKFFVNEQ